MARNRKPSGKKEPKLQRKVNQRPLVLRLLIVCEGEQTEPNYFKGFRNSSVTIKIKSVAKDPLTLVQEADQLQKDDAYDEVWCVFDKDEVKDKRFNDAIVEAGRCKIKVAYSNPCFELWILLHFECNTAVYSASDCRQRLDEHFDKGYSKTEKDLYAQLHSRQATAIGHAETLLAAYDNNNWASHCPSTQVHKLVQLLNKNSKKERFASRR